MDAQTARAREIQRQVGQVLLRNWNPLAIRTEEALGAEYDAYVGPVCRLLAEGASACAIAEHLVRVETEAFGFEDSEWRMLVPVANKLRKLYVRLTTRSDAIERGVAPDG